MDKVFTVSLSASGRDNRVALDLPAEPYTVLDAWERLRPAPDARVRWELEDCGGYPALASVLKSGEDFPALNSLAQRLAGLDGLRRAVFEGLVRLQADRHLEPDALAALAEQAEHCHLVPEATDDASLGRFYAENGFFLELDDVPDRVYGLLDFALLGRRARRAEGGVFTSYGYAVPDETWRPVQGQEPRAAPEAPTGIFRLELRLGEGRTELTLPAGQELVEVRDQIETVGLSNCAVTAFHSRAPQIPAAWATPERLDALNCLAIRLTVLADREPLRLAKYKAVLEAAPPASLEEARALTERLDEYDLDRAAASPEDVAREELRCIMLEEDTALLERHLDLHGYGEALIRQYGGQLTGYGLLTRADGQPVQEPLPLRVIQTDRELGQTLC